MNGTFNEAKPNYFGIKNVFCERGLGIFLPKQEDFVRGTPTGITLQYENGSSPVEHLREVIPKYVTDLDPKNIMAHDNGEVILGFFKAREEKIAEVKEKLAQIKIKEITGQEKIKNRVPGTGEIIEVKTEEPSIEYFPENEVFVIRKVNFQKGKGKDDETFKYFYRDKTELVLLQGEKNIYPRKSNTAYEIKGICTDALDKIDFKSLGNFVLNIERNSLHIPLYDRHKGFLVHNQRSSKEMLREVSFLERIAKPEFKLGLVNLSTYYPSQ